MVEVKGEHVQQKTAVRARVHRPERAQRIIGLWMPDWPVQAAWISGAVRDQVHLMRGLQQAEPDHEQGRVDGGEVGGNSRPQQLDPVAHAASLMPIALLGDTGVVDCSHAARRAGVRRGQSRRHAQAACPELIVVDMDPARDAQEFEPVLERVESVAAGVEALRPGLIVVNGYGPTRYYGSEERAMELLLDAAALPGVDCNVGVADDIVTAILAARRGIAIPEGKGQEFRSHVSLAEIAAEVALSFPSELKKSWTQLGLQTLGDVVRIPMRDMATRFGAEGAKWRGIAEEGAVELVSPRQPPADLSVIYAPEEPLVRVDAAAFVARTLATQLHHRLRDHGLSCYRLAITAVFDDRRQLRRIWRCAEPLDEHTTADRVRWQLDGWLHRRDAKRQEGGAEEDSAKGIIELHLEPIDVVVAGAIRDALWGGADDAAERAIRAAARVQGVLGTEAVTRPVLVGGRGPSERVAKVPVGEQATPQPHNWRGAVPAPNPAMSHPAAAVQLLDSDENPVGVNGRAALTSPPAHLRWGAQRMTVTSWAGPWPVDERWWDAEASHRAARLQVVVERTGNTADQRTSNSTGVEAFLLIGQKGKWRIEGRYT